MTTGLMPLLGLALATISFVGNILICALTQWRATELLYEVDPFESNVTVSQMFFQGIWKFCATTSSVLLIRCKRYEEIPFVYKSSHVGQRENPNADVCRQEGVN